jgi:hypothetical protein
MTPLRGCLVKTWRFLTIMLVAIALSAALAHLMELPGKMGYDGPLYAKLHRTLYPTFGHTAGWAEGAALLSVIGLAWAVRNRAGTFALTATAGACQVAAMAVFLLFVMPANRVIASWQLDAIPPDWQQWRNQWEYGHAARAVLELVALAALVLSVVRETPAAVRREPEAQPAPGPQTPRPRVVRYGGASGPNADVIGEVPGEGLRVMLPDRQSEDRNQARRL